ncbi:MCE family protein [Nocardia puris]|uniref:Phospholipid/cholesterol/gamma-HCH transport system substrate-binding protein n=1 Tax=Nocardia puris TaxID=208602 RepID=A0A366DNE5_9NOCA|nr:MlaD family protein [Nocardia puris]MBF6211456.1 MCE family protein [Nocardia puris]MBF6365173.1 MCE family protein [Nocardia puris]MBF6458959.1 MCE family protein [Nocardia puris]RBO90814.1 phospholipid/cholesterol/gamma-HCH transport system substrate-binding protein [Nocardia puris]
MTRLVRNQLVVFVVIAVLGIAFVGARYIRLDHMLGFSQYEVRVETAQTGGIYKGAEVTYRGVPVGRVGELALDGDGVSITLVIDSSAPDIPASAKAVVANRSAIGEQYVDLQPDSDSGPYLTDGSVIVGAQTPVPVQDLVASVDRFASTVDLAALNVTVTELGRAFDGKGEDLHVFVRSLNEFTTTFHETLPQTVQLIRDGRIALGTQAEQADAIRRFSEGLDALTAQLRSSDPDVRRLIGTGADAGEQLGALLEESGPALTTDLANLRELLVAISPKFYALRPLLQMLPHLSIGASATAPGDGTSHFGLVLETNNPPACTVGYEGTQVILERMKAQNPDFDDTRDEFPFNTEAKCLVPFGNPTAVRGGERAELADPAITQPWDANPKTDPEKLNLTPVAVQLATLMGVTPKR